MIKFEKIRETKVIFDSWYFFLIRDLESKDDISKISDREIIENIIKSKFHQWRGEEEPKGITVSMTNSEKDKTKNYTLKNYKFYGFFNNSKINSSNYRMVTFIEFKKKMLEHIGYSDNNEKSFDNKAQKIIEEAINPLCTFYHLDLDQEINKDKVGEWTTYSDFIAFISLNKQHNIATLIEFGQD